MVERKAFLANAKHHFVHPNVKDKIVVPITKEMEIIMSIQIFLISHMNSDYRENSGKKKLFSQIQNVNIVYPNVENMIELPIRKRMGIIMSIKVCLISRMNFD